MRAYRDLFRRFDAVPGILAGLLVLLATVPVAIYAWRVAPEFVNRDLWRFVELIGEWHAGTLAWSDLWATHSQHRTPGYKLLFVLNAHAFDLNLRLEVALGMLTHALAIMLLVENLRRKLSLTNPLFRLSGCVLLAAAGMSLSLSYFYTFSLLTLSAGISALGFIGALLFAERHVDNGGNASFPACVILWNLLIWLFGAGKVPAMIVAIVMILGWLAIADPSRRVRAAQLAVGLLVTTLVHQYFYWQGLTGEGSGTGNPWLFLREPLAATKFVFAGIGAGVLDPLFFRPHDIDARIVSTLLGGLLFLLALGTGINWLWRVRKDRGGRSDIVFPTLLLFGLLFLGELLVARLPMGEYLSMAPRFTHLAHFFYLGLLGMLMTTVSPTSTWLRYSILAFLAVLVVLIEWANMTTAYRIAPYRIRAQAGIMRVLVEHTDEAWNRLPRWVCPDRTVCEAAIRYLDENKLNVFAKEN